MVNLLVVSLIALPLLGSVLIAGMLRHIRSSTAHYVTLAVTGVTGVCVLALLPYSGSAPVLALNWLPGTGPMEIALGVTGLYAVLVTVWMLFFTLLGTISRREEFQPLSGAVTLLALAAICVALLTEHFLARYVALEVVALCIVLVLLIELPRSAGFGLAWRSYLLLRLGDAGLLVAILILMDASGTLKIGPALEAGGTLDATGRGWVVIGFILAAWVKLGGWPFHLWSRPGRQIMLVSQAWIYAAVMPNLGIYLLYRVAPLLALAGPLQTAALWLGASGALLAALVTLTQADQRTALVYLGAAQGGLVLFIAASGVSPAVWLSLLVITPLRPLLFLAAEAAQNSVSPTRCRVAAWLFALGGLALTAFSLLTTWWARQVGAPLDAQFVAEATVALVGVWVARAAWRLSQSWSGVSPETRVHWTQWMTVGLLSTVVLAGGLFFEPLAQYLVAASGKAPLTILALPALLRYALTAPAVWVVILLAWGVWRLQQRSKLTPLVSTQPPEEAYDLEEGLVRAAQALHAVIEVGLLEQVLVLVVRVVVVDGARFSYRVVEQEGLEGLLRRSVRAALALGQSLQRWHTGRLRHNLLWVSVSLVLAVLALVLYGR